MLRCLFFCLALTGCRYLAPAASQVTPARPALLASDPADPTRQPARMPSRRCVVECGAGFRCNEVTAECEALPPSDGGLSWMP